MQPGPLSTVSVPWGSGLWGCTDLQRRGVGQGLMHAVLAAADALGAPAVFLLGDPAQSLGACTTAGAGGPRKRSAPSGYR
jgi:hypothetical protein